MKRFYTKKAGGSIEKWVFSVSGCSKEDFDRFFGIYAGGNLRINEGDYYEGEVRTADEIYSVFGGYIGHDETISRGEWVAQKENIRHEGGICRRIPETRAEYPARAELISSVDFDSLRKDGEDFCVFIRRIKKEIADFNSYQVGEY